MRFVFALDHLYNHPPVGACDEYSPTRQICPSISEITLNNKGGVGH